MDCVTGMVTVDTILSPSPLTASVMKAIMEEIAAPLVSQSSMTATQYN